MKVGARVVPGSVVRADGGKEYAFRVTDGAYTMPVVYRGIAPDTFTDSVDVVVGGRMGADGTFQATELLANDDVRLHEATISQLMERTEGWPAGLYLATLSLAGRPDPDEFVRRFSGGNRFIGDYLTEVAEALG